MAEDTTTSSAPSEGDTKKKKGGLLTFIKKNKTLSAVVGAGGLYFLWKMRQEPPGEVSAVEGGEPPGGSQEGLLQTGQLEQYETGRAERAEERAEEDTAELEAERTKEREQRKEEKEEREEEKAGKTPETEPGPTPEAPAPTAPAEKSITIHGKVFKGATASHIAGSGQTTGGKKYIEYAITFPGRVEHWWYFTDSGNWSLAKNSAAPAGGNGKSAGKEGTGSGTKTAGQAGKTTGGNPGQTGSGTTRPGKPPKPKAGLGPAIVVAAPAPVAVNAQGGVPQNNAQHPAAVNTGNKCVNGGVGGHTAPAGYHLFCQGGYIWRAPNN